jgi:hypothetical protein
MKDYIIQIIKIDGPDGDPLNSIVGLSAGGRLFQLHSGTKKISGPTTGSTDSNDFKLVREWIPIDELGIDYDKPEEKDERLF